MDQESASTKLMKAIARGTPGPAARPRLSAQRRLEFIEFRLYWQGTLNRADVCEQFKVSQQQASADIGAYQELAPGNCDYDKRAKTFVAADEFKPAFGEPDPQRFLNELRSIAYEISAPEDSWVGELPPFATVPYPRRRVDVKVLRRVLRSIQLGEAMCIYYQSFSRPEPIWRWVTPHALAYDGHRWHARAFCHLRRDFNDFVLGRVLEMRESAAHEVDPALDRQWEEQVELEIGIHPEAPETQWPAIELDHGMTDGRLVIPVRAALARYLMRWMRADLDPNVVGPKLSQIVLLNREAVEEEVDSLSNRGHSLCEEHEIVSLSADYG